MRVCPLQAARAVSFWSVFYPWVFAYLGFYFLRVRPGRGPWGVGIETRQSCSSVCSHSWHVVQPLMARGAGKVAPACHSSLILATGTGLLDEGQKHMPSFISITRMRITWICNYLFCALMCCVLHTVCVNVNE